MSNNNLFFLSQNQDKSTTLVLIHGLFACHLEWEHVLPHLSPYHLLLIDQPSHSRSAHLTPFTLASSADHIAALITSHAHHRTAHIIGLSLGGFVTLELIRRHPDVVQSAFISGCTPFTPFQTFFASRPSVMSWGLWGVFTSGLYRVAERMAGLRPHEGLKREAVANNRGALAREGYGAIVGFREGDVREVAGVGKRVVVVAGGHGDNVEGTKRMGEVLREGNGECRAVVVKDAIHGWNLQFPELFAEGIIAWVEGKELPERFVPL